MAELFISHFDFPSKEIEYSFSLTSQKETCYDTMYPFGILSKNNLQMLDFEPITILYGGNGSGKTTALNVIAEKIKAQRDTLYNRSTFLKIMFVCVMLKERIKVTKVG